MPANEARNMATITAVAAVADNLDRIIDQLFENVAELKEILTRAAPGAPGNTKETP